jgi:hypothetical protein
MDQNRVGDNNAWNPIGCSSATMLVCYFSTSSNPPEEQKYKHSTQTPNPGKVKALTEIAPASDNVPLKVRGGLIRNQFDENSG